MANDVSIHWRIEGTNRVRANLRRWAARFPEILDEDIGDFTQEKAQHLQRKAYPPERPGQTYKRTYNLKNSWVGRKIRAAVWVLENLAEYAGWVVDETLQAWMHRDRWWIFQDEVRPAPDLTRKLTKALEREIAK